MADRPKPSHNHKQHTIHALKQNGIQYKYLGYYGHLGDVQNNVTTGKPAEMKILPIKQSLYVLKS